MNTADKGGPRRPALGRGLGALIPTHGPTSNAAPQPVAPAAPAPGPTRAQVYTLPIEEVAGDEHQPRKNFDQAKLEELASSIRAKGVIQPILVRKVPGKSGAYRIIAGERRWRASQLAGLKEIPAIIKEASEGEAFALALVENLQREDLNPIEEAAGYRRLIEEHKLTQEQVAIQVGKDRSTVANALRLLHLPSEIKESLIDGSLNMGHARALLGVTSAAAMKQAAAEVVKGKLSVRATENLVRNLKDDGTPKKAEPAEKPKAQSAAVRDLVERLQRSMGTKCRIVDSGGKGRVEVEFSDYDELDRLLEKMLGERSRAAR